MIGSPTVAVRSSRSGRADPPIQVEVGDGVRTRLGPAAAPDGVISGDPRSVLAVLLGRMGLEEAQAAGITYRGDPKLLRRIRP